MRELIRRLHLMTGLSVKLFVPVALFSAAIIATVAWVNALGLNRELTEQYRQRALGAAVLFAHEVSETDILKDSAATARHIRELKTFYPDFLRISIYAQAGNAYRVIASSDDALVGAEAEPQDKVALLTGKLSSHEELVGGRRVLEIHYPLRRGDQIVASLGVYVPLTERDRALAALLWRVAALAALTLAGLLGVIYVVARTAVLTPLRSLLEATERVAAGDVDVEIPSSLVETPRVEVRYEVIRFARAFDAMVREIRQDRERLRDLAISDPLTGLHNRRYFEEIIRREVAQAARYRTPFAVAVIDVNGLRETNSRFGHLAGDQILQLTADFLRRNVRSSDEVFRWGGDEFLILMPHTDAHQARVAARRLKAAAADHNRTHGERERLDFSIGLSSWEPGRDREEILQEADARMYEDKRGTRSAGSG